MSSLQHLLGETLLAKSGEVKTSDVLANKKAVALYFSAHWCPPCRGFTPKLSGWYVESLQAKGLEVVFISSDRSEDAFKEYFGEMPWLALPYADRERKETLSKKFKVSGIPSVIILDEDGKLITSDGRASICNDPKGDEFPWKPKTLQEILAGAKLVGKGDESQSFDILSGKVYGLYFSAHWCPPCRGFTPQLAEWYSKDLEGKGLEVVFVSSDRDQTAFDEYFKEMPWLALDFSDRKRKEELSNHFGVRGIPSLVIIGEDGAMISKDGRSAVSADPTGVEFPWHPKPVTSLSQGPGDINSVPTVVAFCEGCDDSVRKAAEAAMLPIAKRFKEAAKAAGEELPELAFAMATSGTIPSKLRSMLSISDSIDAAAPKLMLVDIPDDGGFYEGPEGEITEEAVAKFVADYKNKGINRKQLS